MAKAKAVSLVWYCQTVRGWRRFPVVKGPNNRIKPGYVMIDGLLTHCPVGRFEIRLYEGRKAVYKRAGENAADAQAALTREAVLVTARDAAGAAGVKIAEEPTRPVLRRAAREFEDDAKKRGALEAAEVNRHVTAEFLAVTGKTYADEVTREDVFRFHAALRKRGCSERTVANKHKRLRSFFRYMGLNYTAIMPPVPKYDATLPQTYSSEECGQILAAADSYMQVAIRLGLMCGLRDQEIMHLEWADVRWEDSILRVTSKPLYGFRVKDSEERDIPIPAPFLEELRARRQEHQDGRLVLSTNRGNPDGKLLRRLKLLAKGGGLNCGECEGCTSKLGQCQRWTLHKLRRTYATTLLRNGLDLTTVQRFLGHSDLASTMRYLQPATSAASQAAVNAIRWT